MEFTVFSISGLIGVALYLGAYGALQFGLLRGSSLAYTLLNLAAAGAVLISLGEAFNLSSAIIQISWITLSVIGLTRRALQHARARFDEAELALLSAHFPALAPHQARRFLDLGRWEDAPAGHTLATQGMSLGALIFLSRGSAEVVAHGYAVARLGPGDLIGEMTVIHGGEATADVSMAEDGRLFRLPRETLLREMENDHDFALSISRALQIEAQRKIEAANLRVAGTGPTV